MSVSAFLQQIRESGVELRLDAGRLICDAPKGVLTPEVRAAIGARKSEIVDFLARAQAGASAKPIEPADRTSPIPLSAAQQRLWLLEQLKFDGKGAYNLPCAVRLRGTLDTEALRRSFSETVARHESLRTIFPTRDGLPEQAIQPARPIELAIEDLQNLPEAERVAEAFRLAAECAQEPFDLENRPALRIRLFRLAEEDHVLLVVLHFLVCDDFSLGILCSEFQTLYAGFRKRETPELPALPVQYADYACWQRDWLAGSAIDSQLEFWHRAIGDAHPPFEFPADSEEPATSNRAERATRLIPENVCQALGALTRQEGATLFVTLLAVYKALLCRYTGLETVQIGTSVSNRSRAEIEGLIGSFVNTLVLRTDLSGNPSFRQLIGRVRHVVTEAYGHQDVPFETLVEALRPPRGKSQRPFFECLFVHQSAQTDFIDLPGLEAELLDVEAALQSDTTEAGVSIYAKNVPEGIRLTCYYNTNLFRSETIALMLERFAALLDVCATDADTPIWTPPLPGAAAAPPLPASPVAPATLESQHPSVGSPHSAQAERTAPRDELELRLAAIWQDTLGVKNISVRDSIFDLGGNSLLAARLFARIEKSLGMTIPLSVLFEANTVEKLAEKLRNEDWKPDWSSLVAIRPSGSRPPLFLVHGAEGNVLLYRELAHCLPPDQPVYGLQSAGLDPSREYKPQFEKMANEYLEEIQSLQPQGPYLLGGYCLGGTIAFEMARQLRAQGQEVALVALLETLNVRAYQDKVPHYYDLYHKIQNVFFHLSNIHALSGRAKRDFFQRKLQVEIGRIRVALDLAWTHVRRALRLSNGLTYHHVRIDKANDAAQAAYLPSAYAGRLTLFRPHTFFFGYTETDMGWKEIAQGGLDIHELPVNPHGMLVEPFVRRLAQELDACIQTALDQACASAAKR